MIKPHWLPKVIAIYESKDTSFMNLTTLFSKLQEYEIELKCLAKSKESNKNKKSLTLKTEEAKEQTSDEDMNMLVQK